MSKYHARKVEIDGYTFDSQREARRYNELRMLERAGKISGLEVHPKWTFGSGARLLRSLPKANGATGAPITYAADFAYFCTERNARIIEDVKGLDTPVSRIKRALLWYFHALEVEIV